MEASRRQSTATSQFGNSALLQGFTAVDSPRSGISTASERLARALFTQLSEDRTANETVRSWSHNRPLDVPSDPSASFPAQVQPQDSRHFPSQDVSSIDEDQFLRWIQSPCNLEDIWFDDDAMSLPLDTGFTIPYNYMQFDVMDTASDEPDPHSQGKDTSFPSDISQPITRPLSPPNETSEQDRWPYQWDPSSRAITKTRPIKIPEAHPLRQNHDQRFDISNSRYEMLKLFLERPAQVGIGFHSLLFPELAIANVFIRLFFTHFEPQMAVIHRPSLQSCDDLPDPLLAAMIAIGAIYSCEQNTCRFAIVLTDIARLSSQLAMEANNKLIRSPMFVYALTLLCYVGLWCGNKRLFELSEPIRGTVVSYCRQMHLGEVQLSRQEARKFGDGLDGQWHRWILKESRKRLSWTIYSLDSMFPCLLYLPASISVADFMRIECPCDEEFWHASTAHRWKSLLGSASVPPGRTFASVVSPFLGPFNLAHSSDPAASPGCHANSSGFIGLNSWSRCLVLTTIMVQIYDYSQQINMVSAATNDPDMWQVPGESPALSSPSLDLDSDPTVEQNIHIHYLRLLRRCQSQQKADWTPSSPVRDVLRSLGKRGEHLESNTDLNHLLTILTNTLVEMLLAWEKAYAVSPALDVSVYPTSRHFHTVARINLRLGRLMLHTPIFDLQNMLGKSGTSELVATLDMMHQIFQTHPQSAASMFQHCLETIRGSQDELHRFENQTKPGIMEPPGIITCFLSAVFVWAMLTCANQEQLAALQEHTRDFVAFGGFFDVVKATLDQSPFDQPSHSDQRSKTDLILFSAADVLSRITPWRASLNLALLLFHRGKASITLTSTTRES